MDFYWYELSEKYHFQMASFSQNPMGKRFAKLNHQYMLIAVAQYGGCIAITSDKRQILSLREDDPSIENICIIDNQGQITHKINIPNHFKNIIAFIGFLMDEYLLVVFEKGQEWLVDPYNKNIKKFAIMGLLEGQTINEAKIFENGFAMFTSLRRFLIVRNAFQPQSIEFSSCQQQIKYADASLHWNVFSPKLIISEKVQLHLVHPICGIVQVVENQGKRYFYNESKTDHIIENKLPTIKGIRYISNLSPNRKLIAYFSGEPLYKQNPMDQIPQNLKKKKKGVQTPTSPQKKIPYAFTYRLIIAPSLTSDAVRSDLFKFYEMPYINQKNHLNEKGQPLSIKWCNNRALIVQFNNQQLYMYSIDGDYIKIQKQRSQKQKWSYLVQEIDGTRILSKRQNKIIRQIPNSYFNIFQSFSQEPGALLYTAYEAFEEQAPLQDDQIRQDKKKLAIGVQQCIKASKFELKPDITTRLMKASAYGKAFLPPGMIPNNIVFDTIKNLRIVNHLREKGRCITVDQLSSLTDDHLLKILLRNRQHYLAFEIYNYLKKDQMFRVKIYTDWACCKVENMDESQDYICEQIRQKLENQKGVSFTEIAHKSIEIGRSDLALKLLQFEPSLSKKVPLLLWIGNQETLQKCYKFYQRGLQDALKSRDVNLLFLAIRKMLTSQKLSEFEIFEMFSKHRQGVYSLINYFRLFDAVALVRYYNYLGDNQSLMMQYLRRGFSDRKYENHQKFFFSAIQILKNMDKNQYDWRKQGLPKLYNHFCQFIKHNPQLKYKNDKIKPVTLGKQLQQFVKKGFSDAVDDMKQVYKVSDKRAILTKIKTLIDTKKWQDLQAFVDRHQKQFKIPVEMIADFLLQNKQQSWAMRMMARIPKKQKQQQYQLLQRIGRIREAINLAYDRKDIDTLQQIQAKLLDAQLIAYLNQKLTLLRRR